jgi:hypothetical protein
VIKEALEWYKDAAEAIARHGIVINATALEATVTTLGLDAGQRAEQALMRVVSKEAEIRLLKRAIFETIESFNDGGVDKAHVDKLRALMIQWPREPHPDDKAVDTFAEAMKAKLADKRDQGYYGWWDTKECTTSFLQDALIGHVIKGDPIDVGNFSMFLFSRSETTRPKSNDNGWIVWNDGPGRYFWRATFEECQNELSSDIRPATALEKAFFNANGNAWGGVPEEDRG